MKNYHFKNRDHLFYWTRKMIKKKDKMTKEREQKLKEISYKLYDYNIKNKKKIKEKLLKCPLNVWTYKLYSTNNKNMEQAIENLDYIIKDYNKCLKMERSKILESRYNEYLSDSLMSKKDNYYNRHKDEFTKEFIDLSFNLAGKSGLYKIFDEFKKLLYIGKSYNLGQRIKTSVKERNGFFIKYKEIKNRADTDIYETFLIAKLQPSLNSSQDKLDKLTIDLEEIKFNDKYYKIFKEED